jgi:hypothetical protein
MLSSPFFENLIKLKKGADIKLCPRYICSKKYNQTQSLADNLTNRMIQKLPTKDIIHGFLNFKLHQGFQRMKSFLSTRNEMISHSFHDKKATKPLSSIPFRPVEERGIGKTRKNKSFDSPCQN